jgi:hypothetical protein
MPITPLANKHSQANREHLALLRFYNLFVLNADRDPDMLLQLADDTPVYSVGSQPFSPPETERRGRSARGPLSGSGHGPRSIVKLHGRPKLGDVLVSGCQSSTDDP